MQSYAHLNFTIGWFPCPHQVGISAPPAHLRTPYQVTSFGHLIRGSPLLAQRSELRPKEDPVRFANNRSASCPSCSCHACFHWQTLAVSLVLSCVVLIDCVASLTSGRHRALSSRRRGPGDCVGQCQSSGQRQSPKAAAAASVPVTLAKQMRLWIRFSPSFHAFASLASLVSLSRSKLSSPFYIAAVRYSGNTAVNLSILLSVRPTVLFLFSLWDSGFCSRQRGSLLVYLPTISPYFYRQVLFLFPSSLPVS
jgi:hypothetical protein